MDIVLTFSKNSIEDEFIHVYVEDFMIFKGEELDMITLQLSNPEKTKILEFIGNRGEIIEFLKSTLNEIEDN